VRVGAVLLAALVLLVPACGGGKEELELPVHEEWEDGMDALIGGTVEFDEATECVFLPGDGFRTLIVWPPGTRATRDPFIVVLADGREIREGDHVEGGGGAHALEPEPPDTALPPPTVWMPSTGTTTS
jgi:hypothetical protein